MIGFNESISLTCARLSAWTSVCNVVCLQSESSSCVRLGMSVCVSVCILIALFSRWMRSIRNMGRTKCELFVWDFCRKILPHTKLIENETFSFAMKWIWVQCNKSNWIDFESAWLWILFVQLTCVVSTLARHYLTFRTFVYDFVPVFGSRSASLIIKSNKTLWINSYVVAKCT